MATLLERTDELLAGLEPAIADGERAAVVDARRRLHEPLRVAFAGRIKAGKSTLLNALVGEPLAATDAAECTRFVTWYVYGTHPLAHVVDLDGRRTQVVHRVIDGEASIDLAGIDESTIDRLEVTHPSPHLAAMTLIDTPGIASITEQVSARSTAFLSPEARDQGADVLVYLLRFLHERDPDALEAFADPSGHGEDPVRSVGVLSRADELGGGRGDTPALAARIAADYRDRPEIGRRVGDVVPVSGLLALNGRLLTEEDFRDLHALAAIALADQERLVLSAARFVADGELPVGTDRRTVLLGRFGMTGIRLALGALRSGVATRASELAEYLTMVSGIDPLEQLLLDRYASRAETLKSTRALDLVRAMVADGRAPRRFRGDLERVETNAHEVEELRCLRELARHGVEDGAAETARLLGGRDRREVEAALGGNGDGLAHRAVVDAGLPPDEVVSAAEASIDRLRSALARPLLSREGERLLESAVHSLELSLHRTREE